MRHVTQVQLHLESFQDAEQLLQNICCTFHIRLSHITYMNESCHTCKCVMSHRCNCSWSHSKTQNNFCMSQQHCVLWTWGTNSQKSARSYIACVKYLQSWLFRNCTSVECHMCVLQCIAVYAVCCSALQCVAMYCSVLQYVAVCCSVLQCVAAWECVYHLVWFLKSQLSRLFKWKI